MTRYSRSLPLPHSSSCHHFPSWCSQDNFHYFHLNRPRLRSRLACGAFCYCLKQQYCSRALMTSHEVFGRRSHRLCPWGTCVLASQGRATGCSSKLLVAAFLLLLHPRPLLQNLKSFSPEDLPVVTKCTETRRINIQHTSG